jgi:hypothetical protein
MFRPSARISDKAVHDRLLRDRAVEEAETMFRTYGMAAIEMVASGLTDQSKTPDERRHARLMIVELERLDRQQRRGSAGTGLVVWKPPVLSLAWFRGLLGSKRRDWR